METSSLRPTDPRTGFESGDKRIDEFFGRYAGQNQFRHHVGVTFCAREAGRIIAFATVSAGAVEPSELPADAGARLPRYNAPVLRLARLAVDRNVQGQGIGRTLLYTVIDIAVEMRARVGCVGIVVDSKPESIGFYTRLDFSALPVTSRAAGAGAPPARLFADLRHLVQAAGIAHSGYSASDSLAEEMRRRARELGLTAEEVRSAVDRMLE